MNIGDEESQYLLGILLHLIIEYLILLSKVNIHFGILVKIELESFDLVSL